MFNTSLRTALLGSGAALALMAGPAFAGETDELKAQIDQLQTRLDQLEKQQTATTDTNAAPATAAPADAVVGGDFPGSFKLPGSDTSVAIHGYTKLDMIYSFDARMGDSFVESSIPGNHDSNSNTAPQFRAHARQSRLTIETRTPTNYGQMGTYMQMDFFGTSPGSAGGNNTSNMRLRQAYGTLGNWLFGQTWTNFTDLDDQAETLDFFGPVGTIVARNSQVRYTYNWGKFKIAGALENPAERVGAVAENSSGNPVAFLPGSSVSVGSGAPRTGANDVVNRMPDVTASVNYTDTWGHVAAAGVAELFSVDNGGNSSNSLGATSSQAKDTLGGGGLVGATLNIGNWIGGYFAKDQIAFNAYVGEGLNRYIEADSAQGDAILFIHSNGTFGQLNTQLQYGGFFWYLHNWTDTLRTNAAFGYQGQNWKNSVLQPSTPISSSGMYQTVESVHVNLIWSPVKSVNLGIEYMWGYNQNRNLADGSSIPGGSRGTANQVQFSAQYIF